MFADTGESETVFAPVIQAGIEAFKVSHGVTAVSTSPCMSLDGDRILTFPSGIQFLPFYPQSALRRGKKKPFVFR